MANDKTINYGVQQDEETDGWFFIIFTEQGEDVYESDPGFDSEEEAAESAVRWITDYLMEPPTDT